jgi:FkbM family methyltransferase
MSYHSQLGQDSFVDEFFKGKHNGVFIDIGAHDGVSCSNTLFLEKERAWTGVCIEPGLEEFKKLKESRSAVCMDCAISNKNGDDEFVYIEGYANMLSGLKSGHNTQHTERINREVAQYGGKINNIKVYTRTLQSILEENNISEVDYCSIDTEGSEFDIIKSIDFSKVNIKLFSIENNYGSTDIQQYLEQQGYCLYTKLQWDDIFVKIK